MAHDMVLNQALEFLIEVFDEEEEYKNYLINREKGFRKEAFQHLDLFIEDFETREEVKQMDFIRTLFALENRSFMMDVGFPYPLKKVLNEKLEEYCENGKADEKIFYWAGKYLYRMDYVRKSLAINPYYDDARIYMIEVKLDRLWFATHHLPDYYCKDGQEQEDLKLCEVTQKEIEKLSSEEKRKYLFRDLYFYQELIENYIEWKKSGTLSFLEWGKENNKKVDSGVIAIYYEE
ncbi:hypothetical protein [Gemelliphila palaticanis]|uniref:DUF3843 family protein n=1 Tax=Gemelliphila palaticanis TaxID=81950 RepID=A0ABX2T2D3_9BACL|nr:hypothetical protein [Gemella palaticanis]MBF0715689.1 hypothetical protein [Gemella palaticanis]NYS47619.1 hypothetical protein [Gemella palaticanis]